LTPPPTATADQQHILRLDVPVLDADTVEVVDALGCLAHVLQQLVEWNARAALSGGLIQAVEQSAVGQLHSHDEIGILLPGAERAEQIRMTNDLHEV
jgi:hypothetical protein